jgi:hypothetical protein
MPTQTTELFLLEDLEDAARTNELAERERAALHAVADWITTYVLRPHGDLGRDGPVCPFVPRALERKTLWLVPEQICDLSVSDVAELMDRYKSLFLDIEPTDADAARDKVIVVVFTDISAKRAQGVFDRVLEKLKVPSYADAGVVFGPFYDGNEGTALYNAGFRPFRSPVPFLFVRHTVVSDWKFVLEDDALFDLWARRFGESGALALAEELRRLPWRTTRQARRKTTSPRSA